MRLIVDTREQCPLEFPKTDGVEIIKQALPVGDYGAEGQDVVFERKSISDLFSSFTNNYENERAKIIKAKERDIKYIIAIEATATEIRKGHQFWKDGQLQESQKSGIAQIRQLMTVSRKYGVEVHYFSSRYEMAWFIMEYLMTADRIKK